MKALLVAKAVRVTCPRTSTSVLVLLPSRLLPLLGATLKGNDDPMVMLPAMVGESVVPIFRVPNYNSADARDGILLPVVIGHYGLRFRL